MASNENTTDPPGLGNVCDVGALTTTYGNTLDRNDPFGSESSGTAKFIGGGGTSKFDFHTIKPANLVVSKRSIRSELPKNELLNMLCYLEGELQARDIVIAALRNERIKNIIHAIRYKNILIDDPHAALLRDRIITSGNVVSRQSSSQAVQAELEIRAVIDQQMESLCQVVTKQRQTQVRMVNVLSESLENNQRMRQELEEEKRKHEHDTAQGDDITYGLEMERTKLKQELETERTLRKKYEKDIKKLQEQYDFERHRQKQIVLLLLAERKKIITKYIEERKRSEDLAQILSEEKQRSDAIAEGLEEESKKSLRMEAELEKQTIAIENERKSMKISLAKDEKRIKDLEIEIVQLKSENDAFRKQTISMRMQSSHNVPMLPSKVRPVGDDTNPASPSSMMNVTKVVQPTATVSSVPVSGPTTGIARSISPGQSLRQQTAEPNSQQTGAGSATGPAATYNASAPTKITPRKLSNAGTTGGNTTAGCGGGACLIAVGGSGIVVSTTPQSPSSLLLQQASSPAGSGLTSTLSLASGGTINTDLSSSNNLGPSLSSSIPASPANSGTSTGAAAGPTIGKIPSQVQHQQSPSAIISPAAQPTPLLGIGGIGSQSTILRSGIVSAVGSTSSSTSAVSTTGGSSTASSIVGVGGGCVRGVPPPIPPNKPIVPPKREPSVSRIGSITANNISSSSSS